MSGLAACVSSAPGEDGLFASVHALQTGVYSSRLHGKQQQLAKVRQQQQDNQQRLAQQQHQLQQEQQQVRQLQATVRGNEARKEQKAKAVSERQKRLLALQEHSRALEQASHALDKQLLQARQSDDASGERLAELLRERDQLRLQLESLIKNGF